MRRGPSQENHEGLGTARCASLRARGSPKGAGAVKVGAAQQAFRKSQPWQDLLNIYFVIYQNSEIHSVFLLGIK